MLVEPEDLQNQLADLQRRIAELEAENKELKQTPASRAPARGERAAPGQEASVAATPLNEADVTLRRLVQRIAMILQAEKIVIMFHDRERGELIAIPPAFGVDEAHLKAFRVRAITGISGQVFREGEPTIFHDAASDDRTKDDMFGLLHVMNGVTVPLVIERRDEENRVIDRNTIGVLHAFNKRFGEDFNDEDVRLLERMARNVGSIIANLQLYREVVEEREELLQTFESLSAGLVLISPESRVSQMNLSARRIFAVGQEALGRDYREVLPYAELHTMFDRVSSGEEVPMIEATINIDNQERVYQVQAAQVRNEEGKDLGVVAIFNDVTEMKNIDRMKSSFVAMASHELRTPLTAIKGFVSTLLIDDDFSPEDRREFHMIIDQECDRLTRLINDLLNTARIEANESLKPSYSRVDLDELLQKVVKIQQQSTNRHKIKADVPTPLPEIIGDQDKLDQILTNLMNNAIKYSPGGGDITVHARVEGSEVLIGIEDQGMGIPTEHLPRVFEKFHRVNNEDNRKIYGTGLGLFLVKHLVEKIHMGKIWVDSEVGKGSTFWVRIPIELDMEEAKRIND